MSALSVQCFCLYAHDQTRREPRNLAIAPIENRIPPNHRVTCPAIRYGLERGSSAFRTTIGLLANHRDRRPLPPGVVGIDIRIWMTAMSPPSLNSTRCRNGYAV